MILATLNLAPVRKMAITVTSGSRTFNVTAMSLSDRVRVQTAVQGLSVQEKLNARTNIGLELVDNTSDASKPVSTAQATAIAAVQSDVDTHEADTANPHGVTKAQVGLGNADNTSDANKPVSTAQALAIAAVQSDVDAHEADTANPHSVTKTQVGLGNADNTSDVNKPVSTAQATADALVLSTAEAYADSLVVGLWDDRGNYNASGNVFPSSGGSGSAGAVLKGDIWTISVVGTLGGTAVQLGDTVRALADAPGQTAGNWAIAEHDLGYTPENQANKGIAGGYASLDGNGKVTLAQMRRLVRTAVKTGAYNAAAFDLVPIDVSSGNVAINLPNAPEDSSRVGFKLIAVGGSFAATISTQGSDVFNKTGGVTAATLSLLNQSAVMEYDAGTQIWTIVSNDLPLAQTDARYALKAAYVAVADGVTITPALITSDTTRVDQANTQAAGTLTLANPTGTPVDGEILIVRATCTNAQTLAFGTSYRGTNQLSLPSATTGSGKTDRMVWEYKSAASKWDLIGISFGA